MQIYVGIPKLKPKRNVRYVVRKQTTTTTPAKTKAVVMSSESSSLASSSDCCINMCMNCNKKISKVRHIFVNQHQQQQQQPQNFTNINVIN